ncbi:HAMP domain-containing protein [Leeia sp. TBRC 13508]|uniref:histidine kinase n=1 Tax=Leeia speluncae TaxID=2884804 RepID=A0ABS8DAI4_9NEIS|nr:ATP-binding protein [Leeia speluncae]MCB6184623.1 HAMP domain-containing protein [Leeia speluncae]
MGRLFWKFFFGIWLAQLTSMIGITGTFWLHERERALAPISLDNSPPSRLMVLATSEVLQHAGLARVKTLLAQDERSPVVVLDLAGNIVAGYSLEKPDAALFKHLTSEYQTSVPEGSQSILLTKSKEASYWVMAANSQNSRHDGPPNRDKGPDIFPLVPLFFGFVASLMFAWILAFYFSKPIKVLNNAFETFSKGKLGTRIGNKLRRKDELADLSVSFDQMAQQLQQLMDGQRRLLHDVSHELRSPLARLQAATGLMRQQPDKIERSMDRIEQECERMDQLIGELLTLSRLDTNVNYQTGDELCPLQDLVLAVLSDASFEAEQNGKMVHLQGEVVGHVKARPELLQRAIENVIRNAIRYTKPASTVEVELSQSDDNQHCILRILDEGPGIPEAELEKIGTPFYRASNVTNQDGYGLGLTITRRIVTSTGGTIRFANRQHGGLMVEIVFPAIA